MDCTELGDRSGINWQHCTGLGFDLVCEGGGGVSFDADPARVLICDNGVSCVAVVVVFVNK